MSTTQGKAVADIATTFTDKATPTSAEILSALNRAFEAGYAAGNSTGFAEGVVSGSTHTAEVMDRVMLRMAGEPA